MGDFLPENVTRSTGNYSGYTAFWEVRDGYLCLQRVEADVYDEVSKKEYTRMYEVKDLRPIFGGLLSGGDNSSPLVQWGTSGRERRCGEIRA